MTDRGFLGARLVDGALEVAVVASQAERVELCLAGLDRPERRLVLPERDGGTWHGRFDAAEHGAGPGTTYGFRAHGPWDPSRGLCFDPDRLLLDPYARAVTGAEEQPLGVLLSPKPFDWQGDASARRPLAQTVIYEAHVRGLTRRHPGVPEHLRGTYAAMACPAVLDYLVALGVTAVELLPVHQFRTEPALRARGALNYWGYSTLGFFAPHGAYSASGDRGQQVSEFQTMVRALHAAGLEVLLDVVYNHTCEGAQGDPALSWRGLDDDAYYRRHRGRYVDVTGCGQTVRTDSPTALRLVMDSLRYWVQEMHVDGFRFDLASALARTRHGVDPDAALLAAIGQDPVLAPVTLIAEPWDLDPHGYLLGRFPAGWSEWNDRFRDTVRDVWRGHAGGVRDLGYRLAGSSDLYAGAARRPTASVNLVTSHDGYTLRDLVSYEHKHNEVNGEDNRDGHGDNRSWNAGVEGESHDADVVAARQRRAASLLTTLLLSAGVPMLTAGDERGRTQRGNNNAYCLDDETSWLDWADSGTGWEQLTGVVSRLLALRREHPVLRTPHYHVGAPVGTSGRLDLAWFRPDGQVMTKADWFDGSARGLAIYRADEQSAFLLVLHAHAADGAWTLPGPPWAARYVRELDTGALGTDPPGEQVAGGTSLTVRVWSAVLLRCLP